MAASSLAMEGTTLQEIKRPLVLNVQEVGAVTIPAREERRNRREEGVRLHETLIHSNWKEQWNIPLKVHFIKPWGSDFQNQKAKFCYKFAMIYK